MSESATFNDYIELCKPRVVALMVLTAFVAMLLASPSGMVSWQILLFGLLGITFASCAGGVVNQLVDRHIDAKMARTSGRPLPSGRVNTTNAILMAALLTACSMIILLRYINTTTAVLSFFALIGYAVIYTMFLKRLTPQNIVIGGLAGAMPPLLGWSAVTGGIDGSGLLLVLIIFTWTPPHFWALAIHRHREYAKINMPMLPVTHGLQYTRLNVLLYTLLMIGSTYMPFIINMSGLIYLVGITVLNGIFLHHAIQLFRNKEPRYALKTFHFSIVYLMMLFVLLLVDHFIPLLT